MTGFGTLHPSDFAPGSVVTDPADPNTPTIVKATSATTITTVDAPATPEGGDSGEVETSTGTAGPTFFAGATGPEIQVNGVDAGDQSVLNLTDAATITFSDGGSGIITADVLKYSGTGLLSSGSLAVVMSPGYATTGDYIVFATYVDPPVNPGTLSIIYTNGTHFTIKSSSGTDASTVAYMAIGN